MGLEQHICELLREESGFDASSISQGSLSRVLRQRMDALEEDSLATYTKLLDHDVNERMILLDSLLVGETWFFRTPAAFTELVAYLKPRSRRSEEPPFRIYSLACSSGEEPYSIAMSLLDAGFLESEFHITGVDLNGARLATARAGMYSERSFHGKDLRFRKRYFTVEDRSYVIQDRVRRCVSFVHGNLLQSDWYQDAQSVHAVFCRNVLIYFNERDRERVLKHIETMLASDGRLFVGPAEIGQWLRGRFSPTGVSAAFCYQREQEQKPSVESLISSIRFPDLFARIPDPIQPDTSSSSALVSSSVPEPKAELPAPPRPVMDHEDAEEIGETAPRLSPWAAIRNLADQGQVDQAVRQAEELINQGNMEVEGRYLLGVFCLARNRFHDAESWFRQALYLKPDHQESLMVLLQLMERLDRSDEAQTLRQRLSRLSHGAGKDDV